jgi:hypothetical protein
MDGSPLPRRISLCPLNDPFPSAMDEDQVKTYHCAIHSFPEVSPLCSAEATGYTSVRETPRIIDFVRSEHLHGSSRGWCGSGQKRTCRWIDWQWLCAWCAASSSTRCVSHSVGNGHGLVRKTRCVDSLRQQLSAVHGLHHYWSEHGTNTAAHCCSPLVAALRRVTV